jgi:hypothetical protein
MSITHTKKTRYNNHNKFSLLGEVLDLLLWCPILVLALGILGFVGKSAAPLAGPLGWWIAGGPFCPTFLRLMGHLLQVEALKWSHQMMGF